ncbi:Uncharacterised protein [Serratia fonticola]|nr:Uncharacterised protein [Serratia fonticola]
MLRILTVACSALLPCFPALGEPEKISTVSVSHPYSTPPEPFVRATFTPPLPYFTGGATSDTECYVFVRLYPFSKPAGAQLYRLSDPGYSSTRNPVCFGVYIDGDAETQRQAMLQIANNISSLNIPYEKTWGSASGATDQPTCSVSIHVSRRSYRWTIYGGLGSKCSFSTPPAPVSCVIDGPGVIQHKQQTVGDIRSIASGPVTVTCSGKASVTLSVPSREIRLNSELTGTAVGSHLYMESEGKASTVIQGSPQGHTNVLNVIAAVSVPTGVYMGSSVITANWD